MTVDEIPDRVSIAIAFAVYILAVWCTFPTQKDPGVTKHCSSLVDVKIRLASESLDVGGLTEPVEDHVDVMNEKVEVIDMKEEVGSGEQCGGSDHRSVFTSESEEVSIDGGNESKQGDQNFIGESYESEQNCREREEVGSGAEHDDHKGVVGDDDWEGVERSELERLFGCAVAFVGSNCNTRKISRLGRGVKLQLNALHMVAIQGPCLVPQPMALKVLARANWSAWQQLGDMSPQVAMEHYIDLLSTNIPGWMKGNTAVAKESAKSASHEKTSLGSEISPATLAERIPEERVPLLHKGSDADPIAHLANKGNSIA